MSTGRSIWSRNLIPRRYRGVARVLWALLVVPLTFVYALHVLDVYSNTHWSEWIWLMGAIALSIEAIGRVCVMGMEWVLRLWPRSRSERRWKQGLCFRCGYDLRGCESVTCPECGAFFGTRKHPEPPDT